MKSLLIFIPNNFPSEKHGYIHGKVYNDYESNSKKFFITNMQCLDEVSNNKGPSTGIIESIGYYSGCTDIQDLKKRGNDWIVISLRPLQCLKSSKEVHDYYLQKIFIDNKIVDSCDYYTVIIIYDTTALLKTELFRHHNATGNHFLQLKDILERKAIDDKMKRNNYFSFLKEIIFMHTLWLFMYPVLYSYKITNKLLPIFKYSTLGLHLNKWLENSNWILLTLIQDKKFSLKTINHIFATIFDILLGILFIKFFLYVIGNTLLSQILLDNAEIVVDSLKNLVYWLMGSPAGLKLNYSFSKILGKFFLYHIHFWWLFLVSIKPVMDFFFEVLLLFGRLGITFQIAIAADILALVSFHAYCIYVYAARLYYIQIRGLTALFRLFLGKKKNPLRERVDSCSYQADQLFVGTLLFTILLFLMPTTWVYYIVFTTLRLIIIGFGGVLTRLRFYFQVLPVYAFYCWLFNLENIHSSVKLVTKSRHENGSITLLMTTVTSSWKDTWIHCIPDTINHIPSIEWSMIVKNILWGKLLYPL
ncbi:phosphatidylinositol N-acetylglucosaminyltransferase subunit Q [Chelonus insularis]|uniref:phosphatidylinositol N-acetylglucosaminyltransferase subunit Q n=1 Tax=Chelonus insularis TaxID=460826 RepID=UPI0015894850|nr:phosphatidylinositol N-acetylglucosaminyltransferase subunit Q [Chelonus insularis]